MYQCACIQYSDYLIILVSDMQIVAFLLYCHCSRKKSWGRGAFIREGRLFDILAWGAFIWENAVWQLTQQSDRNLSPYNPHWASLLYRKFSTLCWKRSILNSTYLLFWLLATFVQMSLLKCTQDVLFGENKVYIKFCDTHISSVFG